MAAGCPARQTFEGFRRGSVFSMVSFPTAVPKSKAEYVAQRLLDRIITADLEPGSSFGTEADLCNSST